MRNKELTSVGDIKSFVTDTLKSGQRIEGLHNEHFDPRWFDWQRDVISQVRVLLRSAGFEAMEYIPHVEDIEVQAASFPKNGYALADSGPKSDESIARKIRRPDVGSVAEVFDFLRFTIVVKNKASGEQVAQVVRTNQDGADYFRPLLEEERKLKSGRIIPEENQLGNRLSTSTLGSFLLEHPSEWGINMRIKTGSVVSEVPPHMRVEIRIMTPSLWKFMNDPNSPANPSAYAANQGV